MKQDRKRLDLPPNKKGKREKTLTFFLAQSFSYLAKKSGLFYIILEGPFVLSILAANKRQERLGPNQRRNKKKETPWFRQKQKRLINNPTK